MKKFWGLAWETIKMVVISLAIVLPIRYFVAQPFYVKGASMEPNFFDKEYLIIDEVSYRFHEPQRGDIVVFRYPENPKEYFIKRIIGLPGETIRFKDGRVYIYNQDNPDGWRLPEDYLPEDLQTYPYVQESVTIGSGEYYLLGDNRLASKDSRSFGAVDKSLIIGRALFRGLPLNKAEVIKSITY